VIKDATANPPNPKKFLADLDSWTQKYPNTDFADRRVMYYVQAYSADNQAAKAVDAAKPLVDKGLDGMKEGLEDDPIVLQTLFLTSRAALALAATGSPSAEELATGAKAAQMLADFGKSFFAPEKNRPTMPADQWAAGLKQVDDQAKAHAVPNRALSRRFCITEGESERSGNLRRGGAALQASCGEVSECRCNRQPTGVRLALPADQGSHEGAAGALLLGARGGGSRGRYRRTGCGQPEETGRLPEAVYTTIHGSDEGLADLKALAAKSPNPPADFKIKTASEIAAAKEEEFRTKNPRLAMWMSIKGQLADTNGQQYFEGSLKEHDMSGENGAKLLRGTLVDAKPACRPRNSW
jgi:hypothetical protein